MHIQVCRRKGRAGGRSHKIGVHEMQAEEKESYGRVEGCNGARMCCLGGTVEMVEKGRNAEGLTAEKAHRHTALGAQ